MQAPVPSDNRVGYQFSSIRFCPHGPNQESVVEFKGHAFVGAYLSGFVLKLAPLPDGQWKGRTLDWAVEQNRPQVLRSEGFVQNLINQAARLLGTINMWPTAQEAGGARLAMNQRLIPEEHTAHTCLSHRHDLLSLPMSDWANIWDLIERRNEHDKYFEVLGYNREEIKAILPELQQIFSADWVRARYRQAGFDRLADPLEHEDEGFFPAYHLARTALGGICRDPGWGYLAEIGQALLALRGVEGMERLKRQLTRHSGAQHHLCLAAELHERGILSGLEPLSGSGSARCDLLATLEGTTYQVELKELSSRSPLRRLQSELLQKSDKLPTTPTYPVIFHVVFKEVGARDIEFERTFFEQIEAIAGEIPPKISAVVSGRRFVDANGGKVKHDYNAIILNDDALVPSNRTHLETLFEANYTEALMPFFGVTSFFIFGPRQNELNAGQSV